MADLIRKMQEGHTVEDLDTVIDDVYEARGEYDSLGERLDDMSSGTPAPASSTPSMDGTGSAGTSNQYARADHVHPSDTSKQNALSSIQLDAVNSGIDSTKVAQIGINKNNISLTGYADNIISTSFNWSDGFIGAANGSVNASTQSQFSQPFLLHAGEKVTVQTTNTNIGLICTTTADTVQVGDTVIVLKATSRILQEEAYSYTASEDIKIVICVLKNNYDAYVSKKSSLPLCDWITLKIRSMQST